MVIDALMQIPWLAAILSALVAICKAVWEFCGKAVKQVAVWAAFFIPWLARQASRHIANRLLIAGVFFSLMTLAWSGIISLAGLAVSAAVPWTQMELESNILVDLLWNDPINLRCFFSIVLPPLFGAQSAAMSLRVIFGRLSWAILVHKTA